MIGGGKNSDRDGQESDVEKNLATAGHQTRGGVTSDKEGTVPCVCPCLRREKSFGCIRVKTLRLGQRQIARSASVSQSTSRTY
jgi:hypothetical protein